MEIEKAEKNLIPIKAPITTSNILERKFLLPESSRQKYKHLLARDFSTRELEIIDSFYETCQIIDSETIRYKRFYDQYQEEKAREIQRKIVELADRCENEEEYKLNLKKITDLCHAETYFYVSTITEKRIAQYLQVVPNLINTPV
ncbi:MAG: hypothetical protein Q8O99_01745 [bacterium]|nr:hypothetical protein [bacterium]